MMTEPGDREEAFTLSAILYRYKKRKVLSTKVDGLGYC